MNDQRPARLDLPGFSLDAHAVICRGDPKLSILEVESTEDLCVTSQTGAVCSRSSTGVDSSGEEVVQQHAPPAVDLLAGDPQAAQNVAGLSPQHAPQPVAAAPCPVPLLADAPSVPTQESTISAVLYAEKIPLSATPENISHGAGTEDGHPEGGPKASTEGVQGGGTLEIPLIENCSSSAGLQRSSSPLPSSGTRTDVTGQELHYWLQTDQEKSQSYSNTNQTQSSRRAGGLVVITQAEAGEQASDTSSALEYNSETSTDQELCGGERTVRVILPQSTSGLSSTAPTPHAHHSSADISYKDNTEGRSMEQSQTAPPAQVNQYSPRLLSNDSDSQKTELSTTKPKIIRQASKYAAESNGTVEKQSVALQEPAKEPADTPHNQTESTPLATNICENAGSEETPSGVDPCSGRSPTSLCAAEGEPVEAASAEDHFSVVAFSSNFALLQDCSSLQQGHTELSSAPEVLRGADLPGPGLVDGFVEVEAEASNAPYQAPSVEVPLVSELLHPADTQRIVIVGEQAHITGDWSEVHVNQSYLVQQEDGSICEAAVVNELGSELSAGEPKLYGGSIQLDSQPLEVYEICSLVEEVAEETICVSSTVQSPHSPGYEVNLFNPLLDHSEEYPGKEGLNLHTESPLCTENEANNVVISHQTFPSSGDMTQLEGCSEVISHNVSIQNPESAVLGQHLVLDASRAVQVPDTSEVCVLRAAAPDLFVAEQTANSPQTVTCLQSNTVVSYQVEVGSPILQMLPDKCGPEASAGSSTLVSPVELVITEEMGMDSTLAVSIQADNRLTPQQSRGVTVVNATQPDVCVSLHGGTKENSTLTRETTPETASSSHTSLIINPKFLPHKQGGTPLLSRPPSALPQVSKQQNTADILANACSSVSGTVSEECLPQTVLPVDSVHETVTIGNQRDQAQCPIYITSFTAPHPTTAAKTEALSRLRQHAPHTALQINSVNEALIVTQTPTETPVTVPPSKAATLPSNPQPRGLSSASLAVGADTAPTAASKLPVDLPDFLVQSEEMEQDCSPGEAVSQEAASGHASSPEEGSDEETECDKAECGMVTPSSAHKHGQSSTDREALFLKVRRWIADRVTASSSPVCPSLSSPSPSPGPSSASDWSTPHHERAFPLRGPRGKFLSPSSSSSPPDHSTPQRPRGERHTDMAELAKHEADIEHRTQSLKREGFWSTKRLTRLTEPVRPKVHWDYLCEEMQWLSADFAQERRWKRGVARKVARMVMRYHEELRQKEEKAKRDEVAKVRRIASSIAKEVRAFWSSVEKVVQYKQQSRLEEKRKKALDLQLDFIVGQTEKYSDLLSQSLAPSVNPENAASPPKKTLPSAGDDDDRDFEPPCEEEDDEETIEVEERQEGNDAESHQRELELLKEEGTLPLEELIRTLKRAPDSGSEEGSDDSTSVEEEDGEFNANEEDAEDEEDTIAAQEKVEGNVDHAEELDDLAKEGDMSVDQLLEKYMGAYTSDFEEPSAPASKASSDSEVSGDEEEETEEDESDVESNTSSSDSPEESEEEEDEEEEDGEKDEDQSEEEEDSEEDSCGDEGMEVLIKGGDHSPPSSGSRPKKEISHIAATAESLQPKGYTLATTKVKTPIPFLLHGTLREYQHIGLDWLVTMYEKKLNGILADEMGLGKTIQTIALLAHLACEKGNWGPHLIIVPTSVMLNWEMELKRWCPGFKILTYFGSQKERKMKRQGWTKPNAFHVCITSYKLVLQDHQAFRRKSWRYLILDEAQNIKNFKSQRWQSLLNFNSHRRLLLTGTPLQNSLMELWSLMHFLMPHVFQSHREFKEWFSNPLTGMIEGSQEYNEGLIKRLHKVLRPFLLRRIKVDVEKQMPKKYEHVVRCRLSKRQRFLYDDFMAQASTRETLASGHFMSVINILMQLRKVCNHPNLFDPRPIQSPFITQPIVFHTSSLVQEALEVSPLKRCDLSMFDLIGLEGRVSRYQADLFMPQHKVGRQLIQEIVESPGPPPPPKPVRMKVNRTFQPPPKMDSRPVLLMNKPTCPVPPAAQTPKPPTITEITPAPVVQQVVCSVAPTPPPPRPPMHPAPQTAVRSSTPRPVLTVRPPAAPGAPCVPAQPTPSPSQVMPQRVLLSPDMQARLPSGEVVSIAQLASLAGRPMSSCQGSKPVTFQLQGNKLTLSGAQIHQVPLAPPRPVQGNVMHLVSSGGQHHLISQPAQVAVLSTASTHHVNTSPAPSGTQLPLNISSQVSTSMVSSPGIVKIVVRQSTGKEAGPVPTLAVAPSLRVAPPPPSSPSTQAYANTPAVRNPAPPQAPQRTATATATYTMAPPRIPSSSPLQPQSPRPILKVVQPPAASTEQPAPIQVTSSSSSTSTSQSSAAPRDTGGSSRTAPPPKPDPSTDARAPARLRVLRPPRRSPCYMPWLAESLKKQHNSKLDFISRVNELHCGAKPIYGQEVVDFLTFLPGSCPSPAPLNPLGEWARSGHSSCLLVQSQNKADQWLQSPALREVILTIEKRLTMLSDVIDRFTFVIPPVEAAPIAMHCCHPPPSRSHQLSVFSSVLSAQIAPLTRNLHRIQCNMRTHFPDLRLIQYDCGKLQTLHTLLRRLKTGGHRVLIFTQMTRMLDVLEQFLNYHGHIYLRLDGSTRVEQRQALMERFNADRRIFCFILSTRSGGVGVNLTGADTVVFYDSDWNPTMDAQAQDRCHRIGQTRDVHIYRLISERTVEENILKKANQKRMLGDMAIEGGNFTTAFFKEQTIRDLFDVNEGEKREAAVELSVAQSEEDESVHKQSTTILEQALCRAEDEEDIVAASQAKAEQVAELAEFNENIPLDDGGDQEEVEELSKAEQEIAALVEQLTPIERYAMNFLEASLEDVCKEELKQAEEQVEAARKGLDQAKEEGLKLNASSDDDDLSSPPASVEPTTVTPARRGRKPKDKSATSTRTSGRLRGASPEPDPSPPTPREVPERPRFGLRGRGASKEASSASPCTSTPARTDHNTKSAGSRFPDSSKHSKDSSPTREHQPAKGRIPNRSLSTPVPCSSPSSPPGGKPQMASQGQGETVGCGESERSMVSPESSCPVDHQLYSAQAREDGKDQESLSPPSASSRSPRKRQSADGEVLRGLSEDSPSAKVLRKLPGRLVTVVVEKEPKRRRRRGSGTGGHGSSEEAAEEHAGGTTAEPSRETIPQSYEDKSKGAVSKATQDQDSSANLSTLPLPVRGYPPYSPPHLSPDMPVLRNLPVRRRLETESRMAAQMSEQQHHLGRGRGGTQPRKVETVPGKDTASTATDPSVNSVVAPVKRKRGRPPKIPVMAPVLVSSPPPPPSKEETSPTLSPKRKRGRPRKESLPVQDPSVAGQKTNKTPATTPCPVSKTAVQKPTESALDSKFPPPLPTSPIEAVVCTNQASLSTKVEVPAPVPATVPQPTQVCHRSSRDQACTPSSTNIAEPATSQSQIPALAPPAPPESEARLPALAMPTALPTAATDPIATTAVPATTTVSTAIPAVKQTLLASEVDSDNAGTTNATTVVGAGDATAVSVTNTVDSIKVDTVESITVDTVESITVDTVESITVETIESITEDSIKVDSITVDPVESITEDSIKVGSITVDPVESITEDSVGSITVDPVESITEDSVGSITVDPVESITEDSITVGSITVDPVESITEDSITVGSITVDPVESITEDSVGSITVDPVESITEDSITVGSITVGSITVTKTTNSSPITHETTLVKNVSPSSTQPTPTPSPSAVATTTTSAPVKITPTMPALTVGHDIAVTTASQVTTATRTASTTALKVVEAVSSDTESSAMAISTSAIMSATSATEETATASPSSAVNKVTGTTSPTRTNLTTEVDEKSVTDLTTDGHKMATAATEVPGTIVSQTATSPTETLISPLQAKEVTVAAIVPGKTLAATSTPTAAKTVMVATTLPVTSTPEAAPVPKQTVTASTSFADSTTVSTPTSFSTSTSATNHKRAAVPLFTEMPTKTVSPPSITQTPAVVSSPVHRAAYHDEPSEASASVQTQAVPEGPTQAPSGDTERLCAAQIPNEKVSNRDSEKETIMEVEAKGDSGADVQDKKAEISNSQTKKKTFVGSEDSAPSPPPSLADSKTIEATQRGGSKHQEVAESDGEERMSCPKRSLSRQSSQESACSSSPSSGGSTSTLTRQAHHKKTYENRYPAKKRRVDVSPESRKGLRKEEKNREGREEGKKLTATSQRRRSHSPSSSSDSDQSEDRKERRLTRSAKRGLQDQDGEINRPQKRAARSSERRNTTASTGGESGSDTSSVRNARKYAGSQSIADSKPQANSSPPMPSEPEVLGKRCSALNAAAKLLAMKGRVDTPGHTTRKDPAAKAAGSSPAEKNQKPKSKSVPSSPQTNSVNLSNNKASGSKRNTPTQSSCSASRSTRRCPGSLLPPLETEYKRGKPEEREKPKVAKKPSEGKDGDAQSSRGHSACSSMSSDGEGDGGRSSRSRSSSYSSQRTPSISSQSTGPRESRAASSGSERDRSSERAKRRDKRDRERRSGERRSGKSRRESRRESRRSHKLSQEVSSSSGTEGTPDRVLRSVAALAAVHARSPAASTRSSISQQRHNKT